MGYTLAYLGLENALKRKFEGLTKMEITMTAANGDYLRWEAAEREIENYETILKRWSVNG